MEVAILSRGPQTDPGGCCQQIRVSSNDIGQVILEKKSPFYEKKNNHFFDRNTSLWRWLCTRGATWPGRAWTGTRCTAARPGSTPSSGTGGWARASTGSSVTTWPATTGGWSPRTWSLSRINVQRKLIHVELRGVSIPGRFAIWINNSVNYECANFHPGGELLIC